MKKQFMKPLLTIGLAVCLFCTVTAKAESVLNRAERILQTPGAGNSNVVFTVGPEINDQCDSQGISSKDVDITEAQRKVLRAEISGRFSGVFNSFVSATSSGKDLGATASENAGQLITGSNILFAGVIFVLAVLSFFFMFSGPSPNAAARKPAALNHKKKVNPEENSEFAFGFSPWLSLL